MTLTQVKDTSLGTGFSRFLVFCLCSLQFPWLLISTGIHTDCLVFVFCFLVGLGFVLSACVLSHIFSPFCCGYFELFAQDGLEHRSWYMHADCVILCLPCFSFTHGSLYYYFCSEYVAQGVKSSLDTSARYEFRNWECSSISLRDWVPVLMELIF
jgi:hypothetical protein